MKNKLLPLAALVLPLALALTLLAGCAQPAGSLPTATPTADPTPEAEEAVARCRIVDGAGESTMLLAEENGSIRRLGAGTEELAVTVAGPPAATADLRDGMWVEAHFSGMIQESYPGGYYQPTALAATTEDLDDRCGLWLQVLEDLWTVDSGLNEGLAQVGVDLSEVPDLTESERAGIAWRFGELHGVPVVEGTLEELWQEGYFTPMTEPAEGYPDSLALYSWEDGVHFSIDVDEEAVWSLPSVGEGEEFPVLLAFDAQKWRSGLGAYFFSDCVAQRGSDGVWSYTVGSEAIS